MNASLFDSIDWVGAIDWNVRDFHGYTTDLGSTYNAYLIRDEKTALIDTVKAPFADYLLESVSELLDGRKLDYLVCNHAEPDHSGAMPAVLAAHPEAIVVCNKKCKAVLAGYYDISNWNFMIIEDGQKLNVGEHDLEFIFTPLVHWPESMFTYVPQKKLLFSMDAFGQHLATSERFDDQIERELILREAKRYFANIVMPFSKQVNAVFGKVADYPIEMMAPSHGLIWRTNLGSILDRYRVWASGSTEKKVVILYDTMWRSTEELAEHIYRGVLEEGVSARLIHVRRTNLTNIITELVDAGAVAIGSSTLNKGMMPMVAAALTYMKGMLANPKAGFAFGSSGWGKGGPDAVNDYLEAMKWEVLREPLKNKYRADEEVIAQCVEGGKMLAQKALQSAS